MVEEEEDSLYDRLIEPNRFRIVKYFDPYVVFDIMRSQGVFTMDDQERVMNMYPPTRRARAGQFLDILQTKGDEGVQKYIDVLEYDYPHVFKLITNKDAKEPPKTFKQHRESIRSKWIDRLADLVEMIQKQIASENTSIKDQLEDVKAVSNLNQENVQALENDNNVLREQVRMMSEEVKSLREHNNNLLRERDRLKDDNLRIQKDCIDIFKEKDYYKDKINVTQVERDNLEKENKILLDEMNQLKNELNHNNRSDAMVQKVEKIQNKLRETNVEQDTLVRLEMEKNILKDELVQAQIKAEELAEDMDNLRIELDRSQGECHKLKDKLEKEKRERIQIEGWLHEKNQKMQNYFERIRELELDKQNLEGERNREQQKNRELDLKYSRLFNEKHQQEQNIDMLKLEVQELKLQLRRSWPTEPESPPADPENKEKDTRSEKSSQSSDNFAEFIHLEAAVEIIPWKTDDYAGRPVSGPFMRSGSFDDSRDKWTVKMKMPLLDKISITGGNFTGIFVEKTSKKFDVPKPGDKIESMCRITGGFKQEDFTSFEGFTHIQAREKLSFRHHADEMEVTFRRRKINNTPESECVNKWMAENKNSKRGDYFYVRAEMPYLSDSTSNTPKHKIQTGDIFLVQDTCPSTANEWQALKFDKKRGDWAPLSQSIPDSTHTRGHMVHRQQSSDPNPIPGRKLAMKKRNLYTNVFPMKAVSKLPVWMVGPQDVVVAVQNLMCRHHSSLFTLANTGNLHQALSTVKTQSKHVLVHVNTQACVDRIGILLYFNVQAADPQILSQILNKQVSPDATTINEDMLKQQGLEHEEVNIPSEEIDSEHSLVQTVYKKINNLQKQILWLSDSRLKKYKPEILEDYRCFFTERNITMLYSRINSSQDEQSNSAQETLSNTGQETCSNSGNSFVNVRKESVGSERNVVCNSIVENV